MRLVPLFAAALSLCLVGCSSPESDCTGGACGGGGGSTGAGGGTAAAEAACIRAIDETNALSVQCGEVNEAYLTPFNVQRSHADCALLAGFSTLSPLIECMHAEISARGCLASPSRCGDLRGDTASGGSCFGSFDCAAGLFCDTSSTCPGKCAPAIAAGKPVENWQECAPDAYEDNGVCLARAKAGPSWTSCG